MKDNLSNEDPETGTALKPPNGIGRVPELLYHQERNKWRFLDVEGADDRTS